MSLRSLALLSVLVGATASPAATYRDPTYGLTVDIPEGYALKHKDYGQGAFLLLTRAEAICAIDYTSGQELVGTQAEINARAKPILIATFRRNGIEDPIVPFVLGDVEGIAAESTITKPGRATLKQIVVFLETTKGHAHFACADTREAFAASKPIFERLFRSIHLP